LNDADKKKYKYSRYMLHRFLSMNVNYAPVVNELQKYPSIPDRAHYQFLTNILPRGKQYNKYIKGSKDEKYEKWLVELVAKHYQVSKVEAITYLEIYYTQNKDGLRQLCEKYGIDKKELKKVKL
jgi:Glu-tRNA(Gln) amidotransferase subunit E-like FAD-binding protein